MINKGFVVLSIEEKQTKLKNALRSMTGGCLSDSELDQMLRGISVKRQYFVHVHCRIDLFRNLLTLAGADYGHVALGQAKLGQHGHRGKLYFAGDPAAVIIHRQQDPGDYRELHIYLPRSRSGRCFA